MAVVTLQHLAFVGDVTHHASEELQRIDRLGARSGSGGLVGIVGSGGVMRLIVQPAKRHGVTGAVAGEPYLELLVVGCGPHAVVHLESRVRPSPTGRVCPSRWENSEPRGSFGPWVSRAFPRCAQTAESMRTAKI